MTTDPHLDDLLDIVIGVVVADALALTNEKPAAPGRALLRVKDRTWETIPQFSPPAN